ncbi:hypothetical protein Trydic_g11133 [Trypoxylus dichotomus]
MDASRSLFKSLGTLTLAYLCILEVLCVCVKDNQDNFTTQDLYHEYNIRNQTSLKPSEDPYHFRIYEPYLEKFRNGLNILLPDLGGAMDHEALSSSPAIPCAKMSLPDMMDILTMPQRQLTTYERSLSQLIVYGNTDKCIAYKTQICKKCSSF